LQAAPTLRNSAISVRPDCFEARQALSFSPAGTQSCGTVFATPAVISRSRMRRPMASASAWIPPGDWKKIGRLRPEWRFRNVRVRCAEPGVKYPSAAIH